MHLSLVRITAVFVCWGALLSGGVAEEQKEKQSKPKFKLSAVEQKVLDLTNAERKKNDEQAAAVGEDRAAEDAPEHAAIDGAGVRHEHAPEKIKSTDLKIGPTPNPQITGTKTYTRAHFLHYARVVESGLYR